MHVAVVQPRYHCAAGNRDDIGTTTGQFEHVVVRPYCLDDAIAHGNRLRARQGRILGNHVAIDDGQRCIVAVTEYDWRQGGHGCCARIAQEPAPGNSV